MKNYFNILLLFISQIVLCQTKPIYSNSINDFNPFIGTWYVNNNGYQYTIFLSTKKIINGGAHAINKYTLIGEYVIKDANNRVIIDSRSIPKAVNVLGSMRLIKADNNLMTKFLNFNDLNEYYFVSFNDYNKCNTPILGKIRISATTNNSLIWESEIKPESIMDSEGVNIKSNSAIQQEIYGCVYNSNRDLMTIPKSLTFTKTN